jgi:hypothetical protein
MLVIGSDYFESERCSGIAGREWSKKQLVAHLEWSRQLSATDKLVNAQQLSLGTPHSWKCQV